MTVGIDVHPYYQRGLDWSRVSGVTFAWVKLTDGGTAGMLSQGVRYFGDAHVAGARSRGIPVGGYCYAQPGDGAAHADVLLGECLRLGALDLTPVIDIESNPNLHTWTTSEAITYGRAFCARMLARGYRPAVYANATLMRAMDPAAWPEQPVIWVARYGALPQAAGAAQYSGRYDVHQYRSDGPGDGLVVPGVAAGNLDQNESYTTAHLNPAGKDWLDMATQQEIQQAVHDGVLAALQQMRYGDRYADGRNAADEDAQQTASLLAMQAQLDKVISGLGDVVTALGKLAPGAPADTAAVAKAVVDEEAKRLQS